MAERKKISFGERVRRFFLDLDARIDSGLFEAGRWARELYERFVTFMDRFHVAGWRRWVLVEPASEAATLGTVGLVLALALALPAFYETKDEDWLKKSELAVQFLDRYGNEVGARGIKLHPRAQRFLLNDERLAPIFAISAERRVPILIHGGRGLPPIAAGLASLV